VVTPSKCFFIKPFIIAILLIILEVKFIFILKRVESFRNLNY